MSERGAARTALELLPAAAAVDLRAGDSLRMYAPTTDPMRDSDRGSGGGGSVTRPLRGQIHRHTHTSVRYCVPSIDCQFTEHIEQGQRHNNSRYKRTGEQSDAQIQSNVIG